MWLRRKEEPLSVGTERFSVRRVASESRVGGHERRQETQPTMYGEGVQPTLITCDEAQVTSLHRQLPCQRRTDAVGCSENENSGSPGVLRHG